MQSKVTIRRETESHIEAIYEVTIAAFRDHPYSHQTEQYIIRALRNAKDLALSLVAEVGGKVVGHIAFSPVSISAGSPGWYGVGPVSVLPELQRQGIGKSLVREGLSLLKAAGAKGCCSWETPATMNASASGTSRSWSLRAFRSRIFSRCPSGNSKPPALWYSMKLLPQQGSQVYRSELPYPSSSSTGQYCKLNASATALYVVFPSTRLRPRRSAGSLRAASFHPFSAIVST